MNFHRYSLSADQAIDIFNKSTLTEIDIQKVFFYKKLASCDVKILLVTLDGPDMERLTDNNYDSHAIIDLFNSWRSVAENSTNIYKQNQAWRMIDQIGETLQTWGKTKSSPILRRFKFDSGYNQYFVLLNGQEPQGIPASELNPLCNIWQLANGYLPLHAAGVIHKNKLFVFTGPSGAGKSTVTKLSHEIGDATLDEDQLLIYKSSEKIFQANAWGYSLAVGNLPIRAVFKLIQNVEDKIVPMQPAKCAQLLFERHNDIMGNQFSDDLLKLSFKFVAELARQIPGYELHFRKSPDFWKLIDEQFPG